MTTSRADLRRGVTSVPSGVPALHDLDARDPWDAVILAEASLLRRWTGVANPRIVHCSDGTAAGADGTIYVDRCQLDELFSVFSGEKYKTAVFLALAHEFGHLCQFTVLGVDQTFALDDIHAEAHADYLAGVWLGLRLAQGEDRLPEDLLAAGLQLKAESPSYPSPYQRGCLMQFGQSALAWVVSAEQRISDPTYTSIEVALTPTDVTDLLTISLERLSEIPEQQPK